MEKCPVYNNLVSPRKQLVYNKYDIATKRVWKCGTNRNTKAI